MIPDNTDLTAGAFAEGAKVGAPDAIQVADRWHLLRNLGDAVVSFLDRHRHKLPPSSLVDSSGSPKKLRVLDQGGEKVPTRTPLQACPEAQVMYDLAQRFGRMVRERRRDELPGLLDEALSGPCEMRGFAKGIERDYDAVQMALQSEWSNGQTEGQIHRLKLIKRAMYGRGNLALLRRRLLTAA